MSEFSQYQETLVKAAREGRPSVRVEEIRDQHSPYYHVTHLDAADRPIVQIVRRTNGAFACMIPATANRGRAFKVG